MEHVSWFNFIYSAITGNDGEIKQAVKSADSAVNKKIEEMEEKISKQAETILHQQLFLEAIDRREREANMIVTGVPDEHEALDGTTSDTDDKLNKIWSVIG